MLTSGPWLSRLFVALLSMALLGFAMPARSEIAPGGRRVALVIGNGDYRNVDHLTNAPNDARLIAETLRGLGFLIVGGDARLNLDREHLSESIRDFGKALAGAEVGLFYYSGHGLQVKGVNWLVPVDASPASERDLDFQMVDADLVLRQMDGIGTKLNIVLLDACRNNPFAVRGLRALQAGLAEMRAPEGTLISYATQPGNVAVDGVGANSPYTAALANSMKQPGLDIFRLFNQVGLTVKKTTDGRQQPWVSTSPIDGDFYFARPAPPASASPPIALTPVPDAPLPVTTALAPLPVPPLVPLAAPAPEAVARSLVEGLPCSILAARKQDDRVTLAGLARPGPEWDDLVRRLNATRALRLGRPVVEFLPEFACPVVEVLRDPVREARLSEDRRLILSPPSQSGAGGVLTVTLRGVAGGQVLLDVFRPDGMVEHLAARADEPGGDAARFSAPSPKSIGGQRLLTAVFTDGPLLVGARPAEERTATWLAVLRDAIRTGPGGLRADMVVFELRPIASAVTPERPRPAAAPVVARPPAPPARCHAILERAQLGEAVSDDDRAFLRQACR